MPNPISGSSVTMRIVLPGKQIMVDDDEIPDEKFHYNILRRTLNKGLCIFVHF